MGRKTGLWTAGIALIGIGAFSLAITFGWATWDQLRYVWPLILISLGLEILMSRKRHASDRLHLHGAAVALLAVALLAGIGGSLWTKGFLTPVSGKELVTDDVRRVLIRVPSGAVTVLGVQGTELSYDGELRIPAPSLQQARAIMAERWYVRQNGDTLELGLSPVPGQTEWFGPGSLGRLTLQVPDRLLTAVEGRNGAVSIRGMKADSRVTTSNGSITFDSIQGNVQGTTSNGACTAKDVTGAVELHSSNGQCRITRIGGQANIRTSNGGITAEHVGGTLRLVTSNGGIDVTSTVRGLWDIRTTNGPIRLTVPDHVDASIRAQTSSGAVRGDVPWRLEDDRGRRGTAVLGMGTHQVELATSNGSITVETAPLPD